MWDPKLLMGLKWDSSENTDNWVTVKTCYFNAFEVLLLMSIYIPTPLSWDKRGGFQVGTVKQRQGEEMITCTVVQERGLSGIPALQETGEDGSLRKSSREGARWRRALCFLISLP